MTAFLLTTLLLCLQAPGTGAAATSRAPAVDLPEPPALWAGLAPEPYRVGYRRLETDRGVVHTWYPAAAEGGTPLVLLDLLGDGADSLAAFMAGAGVDTATVRGYLRSPLLAVASPPPLPEPFPLVLVAQGNGEDAGDQAVLCEYLAGRGLVVATTPSPTLRIPLTGVEQVGEVAEAGARDLAAAIGPVAAFTGADTTRLGAVGHSFGARSALLLAMSHPGVRALVSLDGGIGTATAVGAFRSAPSFDARAPLPRSSTSSRSWMPS